VNSWHFYLKDYEQARAAVNGVVAKTYSGSNFNYIPASKKGAQPDLQRNGGIGALDGDIDQLVIPFLTMNFAAFAAGTSTLSCDVEWERNGFLNTTDAEGFGYADSESQRCVDVDGPPIRRCARAKKSDRHLLVPFSRKRRCDVVLQWRFSGIDSWAGSITKSRLGRPIRFPSPCCASGSCATYAGPDDALHALGAPLCPMDAGRANYIQFFVDGGAPSWQQRIAAPSRPGQLEQVGRDSFDARRSGRHRFGPRSGCGWFEWKFRPDRMFPWRGTDAPLRSVGFPPGLATNRPL
jgi:hypothetical protein